MEAAGQPAVSPHLDAASHAHGANCLATWRPESHRRLCVSPRAVVRRSMIVAMDSGQGPAWPWIPPGFALPSAQCTLPGPTRICVFVHFVQLEQNPRVWAIYKEEKLILSQSWRLASPRSGVSTWCIIPWWKVEGQDRANTLPLFIRASIHS